MHVGAGKTFSVPVVFARQEFETWLIAGVASLAGRRLPDGRLIEPNAKAPDGDLELSPRDAKGWLRAIVEEGYKPTRDQAALTTLVDLSIPANKIGQLIELTQFQGYADDLRYPAHGGQCIRVMMALSFGGKGDWGFLFNGIHPAAGIPRGESPSRRSELEGLGNGHTRSRTGQRI
jgi:hypothetical protein